MKKKSIIFILLVMIISCSRDVSNNEIPIKEKSNIIKISENNIKIQYVIQKEDSYSNGKCSVIVLLREKVTNDQIKILANLIRSKAGRKKYNPLFIEYYLPGMIVGSGAYATSHYNPDLKINIMDFMLEGNSPEKESVKAEKLFNEVKKLGNEYTFHR